jgi:acetyl-CoA carboxylase biotin carboxyl carrier protein
MPKEKTKKPKLILGVPSELIESYIKFVEENELEYFEITEHGTTITIKRGKKIENFQLQEKKVEPQLKLDFVEEKKEVPPAPAPETSEMDKYHKIISPLPGTFYRAPAPNAPPFVNEGDTVSQGQTLCIVEAMKVMNKITSDINGKIIKILFENAQPVKQGDVLFLIQPL